MALGVDFAHLSGMLPSTINGQEILEEEYNEDYDPTSEEVKEYCEVLGLDPVKESDLLYIAREAIKAPLPHDWKPCKNPNDEIYYFNFQTGESSWDHPCDKYYVELLEREREKKRSRTIASKKKNTTSKQAASLMGTPKLQSPANLSSLPKKGLNPLPSLPPLKSGAPQLGLLKLPPGKATQSQPPNTQFGGGPHVAIAAPRQLNIMAPAHTSTPPRPTLNPEKEIMKGISTTYEEEDDDDSDIELSDKELLGASGFHSKFGNIMDAGDLGANLSISDEDEDIDAELQQLQHSSNDSSEVSDPLDRGPKLTMSPKVTLSGEHQNVIRRNQRPSTARGDRTQLTKAHNRHEDLIGDDTASSVSLSGESRLPHTVNVVDLGEEADIETQIAATAGLFQQSHNLNLKTVGKQNTTDVDNTTLLASTQHVQQSLDQEIAAVKRQHEEELASLRRDFEEKLVKEKNALKSDQEAKIAAYKNELSIQQITEENKIQADHQTSLDQIKDKLSDAQIEEESKLEEEKSNFLRNLKQQIIKEKLEKEDKMRKDLEAELNKLRHQFELDKAAEEKTTKDNLEELKKTLQITRREELDSNETEFEQQLTDLHNLHQSKLEKAKEELEAEHSRQIEETKNGLEKDHQKVMAEINTRYTSIRKTEEEKLQQQEAIRTTEEELETELAVKKTELQQQHEQQLEQMSSELKEELAVLEQSHQQQEDELKKTFAVKLTQLKNQLEEDNSAQLESLQNKLSSVQQDLQSQIVQVEKELDSKRKQAEQERIAVQQLLATIESEKEMAETQRRILKENQNELAKEQQHIQQLRNASGAEADQLLAKQQSELKDDIEQDQKLLADLKRQREQLQREIDALTKEKLKLEANIEELTQQERAHCQELESIKNQIRKSKEVLAQITDELNTTQERLRIELTSINKQPPNQAEAVTVANASLQELSASQESEDTLRSSSGHTSASMSVRELASPSPTTDEVVDEAIDNRIKVAWEEKLEPATQSNSQVQQRLISEAKQLKRAQDFLLKQKNSIKKKRAGLMQSQKSWMTDQRRTNEHLMPSASHNHMITPKKFEKVDGSSDDVPSSQKNTTYERQQQFRHHRLNTEPLSSENPKSSLVTTDTDEVLNSKHSPWKRKKHKLLEKHVSSHDNDETSSTEQYSKHAVVPSSEIMNSLSQINSQLGEVLTRLAPSAAPSAQPYPSSDPLLQPARPDKTEKELHSKWQQYLGHIPPHHSPPLSYVPDVRRSSYNFGCNDGRETDLVRKSTSEMYKDQTDWLKTFQQEMSAFNRPTMKAPLLTTPSKSATSNLTSSMQSRTPKFILDSRNNIHFIHV